jgi:hypothetical protein
MVVKIEPRRLQSKVEIMSEQLLHELFRGVESVVHERLGIAEDLLQRAQASELAEMVKVQGYKIDSLSMQLHKLSEQIAMLTTLKASELNHPHLYVAPVVAATPAVTASPAVAAASPVLKNVLIGPSLSSSAALVPTALVPTALVPTATTEEDDAEVEEEDDAEVEEEEDDAEVEVEEEAVELEEFTYKGKTYYKDGENQVYQMDKNGDVDETPVGIWNDQTKRIHPIA